ncbi:MAG: YkgJ family cysteine cluster protein [Steroidobacteraceae bacterium]
MEIEIDIEAIRELTAREYEQVRADLAAHGPAAALECSQQRHDTCLATAPDAPLLACKDGCFWCCYYSVDVRPVEVLRILDAMRLLPEDEQTRIATEVQANSALVSTLDDEERTRRNIKCPFLAAGRCVIYAARPQTCRNYHATNAVGCQRAFEEPDNLDIDPEFAPLVYQRGRAHVDAFSKAMSDAGYDTRAYELNSALAAALLAPERARERLEQGSHVFPELPGTEVPLEFMGEGL